MPNPSKRKGDEFEREVVAILQDHGVAAEMVPLSGAVKGGSFDRDIDCRCAESERKLECKRRARAFKTLYGFLANNYAVALRDDRTPSLIVMRLSDFAELAK